MLNGRQLLETEILTLESYLINNFLNSRISSILLMEDSVEGPLQPNHWLRPYYIGFLPEILQGRKRSRLGCLSHSHVWNFYTFFSLTYKVGAPIPITGVQFGMRVEFGYDCLIPADFNNDVSSKTFKIPHLSYSRETHTKLSSLVILAVCMLHFIYSLRGTAIDYS